MKMIFTSSWYWRSCSEETTTIQSKATHMAGHYRSIGQSDEFNLFFPPHQKFHYLCNAESSICTALLRTPLSDFPTRTFSPPRAVQTPTPSSTPIVARLEVQNLPSKHVSPNRGLLNSLNSPAYKLFHSQIIHD